MFFQPFGLQSPGGGPRILRSLITGKAADVQSVCTSPRPPPATSLGQEWHIPSRPDLSRFERTRFTPWLDHVLRAAWEPTVRHRMEQLLSTHRPEHVHLVAHSDDFWPAFQSAEALQIPVTLAVHDDFSFHVKPRIRWNITDSRWRSAWNRSARRIVISAQLGNELNRRYGNHPFDVITDSLDDVSHPHAPPEHRLNVYFMGALHLSYRQNFTDLMRAMALADHILDSQLKLIVRGGTIHPPTDGIAPESRPWGSERDVADDLKDVDFLYLPLPFDERFRSFVRFSLSTKMITYLGSGIPILYHGPAESAVAELLTEYGAALLITAPGIDPLVKALHLSRESRRAIAEAAGKLARQKFLSSEIRCRFWAYYENQNETSDSTTSVH